MALSLLNTRKTPRQKSRSPSPKRNNLADATPKNQLGNFSKLFALLNFNFGRQPSHSSSDKEIDTGPYSTQTAATASLGSTGSTAITSAGSTVTVSSDSTVKPLRPSFGSERPTLIDSHSPSREESSSTDTMGLYNHKGQLTTFVDGRTLDWSRSSAPSPPSSQSPSPVSSPPATPPQPDRPGMSSNNWRTPPPSPPLSPPPVIDTKEAKVQESMAIEVTAKEPVGDPFQTPASGNSRQLPKLGSDLASVVANAKSALGKAIKDQDPPSSIILDPNFVPQPPSPEIAERLFQLGIHASRKVPHSRFQKRIQRDFARHDEKLGTQFSHQLGSGTHIFIDWSNLLISCRETVREQRGLGFNAPVPSMNFERVKQLLERERTVLSRHLAGSRGGKFANKQLKQIEETGYEVMGLTRVPRGFRDDYAGDCSSSEELSDVSLKAYKWGEQCVDEMLQLKMGNAIYRSLKDKCTGVMVLATGDGNDAEFAKGGFRSKVEDALEDGWCVELYAFKNNIASIWRNKEFQAKWDGHFTYHLLDEYAQLLVERD